MLRSISKINYLNLQEAIFEAFNDSYPPPQPSNYTPVLGDTFSSIAALFSQNSAYASTIAMANGLNAGDVPQPGEQIFLPQFLSNYNNYATLPPSGQIISKLYGSLYPILQTIQPPLPKSNHHSFWGGFFGGIGIIILAIVAVVVCVYLPGAGLAVAGTLFGAGTATAAAMLPVIDAVLLVMAGLAQEELTVQMGLAAHFSLAQSLIIAFEDNEGAGLGALSSLGMSVEEFGLMVLAVGVANIEEQFLAMDLGLQKGFSLREVASAIVTEMAILGLDSALKISNAITEGETAGKALENDLKQEVVGIGVQTLVDKEIAHQAFNLQATIEGAIGTVAGEFMVQEAQIAAMQQYQQAQQAAQNASQQQSAATPMSKYGMYRSNAAQSGGAASSAYGSGNTISTSSVDDSNSDTSDLGTAFAMQDTQTLANTPISQLAPLPSLSGAASSNPYMATSAQPITYGQALSNAFASNSFTPVVMETAGIINGTTNTIMYPLFHPINTITGTLSLVYDVGIVAMGADYNGTAYAQLSAIGRGISSGISNIFSAMQSSDAYTRGYALGSLGGSILSIPFYNEVAPASINMLGEGVQYGAANLLFSTSIDPEGAMARQMIMLQQNTGYNVSPTSWFYSYPQIGQYGTYITDYQAVTDIIGDYAPNQQITVGLFSNSTQVSFFKSTQLALSLGLENPAQLNSGFVFSQIDGIVDMAPQSPIYMGNNNFLGGGQGLPGGGPEIVINPLQTKSWPWSP